MASPTISIQLASGLQIEVDPNEWPLIGEAEWTTQRDGGVVESHVLVRRHSDGRTVIYIDANPGGGPLVKGDLLSPAAAEVEDSIQRFGELHGLPEWVVERCVQSVRG